MIPPRNQPAPADDRSHRLPGETLREKFFAAMGRSDWLLTEDELREGAERSRQMMRDWPFPAEPPFEADDENREEPA